MEIVVGVEAKAQQAAMPWRWPPPWRRASPDADLVVANIYPVAYNYVSPAHVDAGVAGLPHRAGARGVGGHVSNSVTASA